MVMNIKQRNSFAYNFAQLVEYANYMYINKREPRLH